MCGEDDDSPLVRLQVVNRHSRAPGEEVDEVLAGGEQGRLHDVKMTVLGDHRLDRITIGAGGGLGLER